jgi:hypothetical protein
MDLQLWSDPVQITINEHKRQSSDQIENDGYQCRDSDDTPVTATAPTIMDFPRPNRNAQLQLQALGNMTGDSEERSIHWTFGQTKANGMIERKVTACDFKSKATKSRVKQGATKEPGCLSELCE